MLSQISQPMIERLYRHILLPAHEGVIKRRPTLRYWRELEKSQWLRAEELQARQLARLRVFLAQTYDSCPYYRKDWDERGLHPRQVRTLDDFRRWPLLSRDVIRENRLAMRSTSPGLHLIAKATGGSSGVPLSFDLNSDSDYRRMAACHRGYAWAGAAPGTRQIYLWGVPLGNRSLRQRWKDNAYNWKYRRRVLNCFELSDDRALDFEGRIRRYRPDVIVAYTNPLYSLARVLDEKRVKPYSPRSIVVGAEKLHDFQRALIERVFQAPVFETYGSREFMLIGAECEHHAGLHLTMEHLLVEVVDDDGQTTLDGAEGNVVITDLYNVGMPFVRYANGDRAVAGFVQCRCGRGLPMLSRIMGRRLDILTTPDGRQVPGELFPHLFKDYAPIRRFQVVQSSPGEIDVRLVVDDSWDEADHNRLERQIREIVGHSVVLCLNRVDAIPLTRSGKLQVVVNQCRSQPATTLSTQ